MTEKRIVLTKSDFNELVCGNIVEQDGVKIILQDIGFVSMINLINAAAGDAIRTQQNIKTEGGREAP